MRKGWMVWMMIALMAVAVQAVDNTVTEPSVNLVGDEEVTIPANAPGFVPGAIDELIGDTVIVGTSYWDAQHNAGVGRMLGFSPVENRVWMSWAKLHQEDQAGLRDVRGVSLDLLNDGTIVVNDVDDVDGGASRSGYTNTAVDPMTGTQYFGMHTTPMGDNNTYTYAYRENPFVPGFYSEFILNAGNPPAIWPKMSYGAGGYVHEIAHGRPAGNTDPRSAYYMRWEDDEAAGVLMPATNGDQPYEITDILMNISGDVSVSLDGNRVAVGGCVNRFHTIGEEWNGDGGDNQWNNDIFVFISENGGFNWNLNSPVNVTQFIGPNPDLLPDTLAANGDMRRAYSDCSFIFDDENRLRSAFTAQDFEYYSGSVFVMSGIWHHMKDDNGDDWWSKLHYQEFTGVTVEGWGRTADRPSLTFDMQTGILWCVFRVVDGWNDQGETTDFGADTQIGNGDIFVSASPPGEYNGLLWTKPVNITDTKWTVDGGAPAGECRSESDPSVALRSEGDYLHIQYTLDLDAGTGIGSAPEGSITNNPIVYHRVAKSELLAEFEDVGEWVVNEPLHVDEYGFWQDPGNYEWDTYGGFFTGPRDDVGPSATLTLTGLNTIVPPNGGNLLYEVSFESSYNTTIPGVTYWTTATLPNGTETATLFEQPFTHMPNMSVTTTATQAIPGFSPAGTYSYNGFIGFYPNPVLDDSFEWTKMANGTDGAAVDGLVVDAWSHSEIAFEGETTGAIAPDRFELSAAYPNPFNPTTRVSVTLPRAGKLDVAVVNVAGRQVATLANSHRAAGSYQFTFDASDLASGMYFIRASLPGESVQMQKVMLIK